MPLRLVAVEKETGFQNRVERWSNVYCYDVANTGPGDHAALADAVLAAERTIHTSAVTFKRTRVFTVDGLNGVGTPGVMYDVQERNVTGTLANSGNGVMYVECAVLCKWPLPRKQFPLGGVGRQRSLKKWIHPGEVGPLTATSLNGKAPLSTTEKAPFLSFMTAIRTPTNGILCSPGDGTHASSDQVVHPYVEHRQFPRGRKEYVD